MRMTANVVALKEKRGANFDKWLQGIARSVVSIARETRGGLQVDDQREQG